MKSFAGSSWISKVRYDPKTRQMWIHVANTENVYEFEGVPADVYDKFEASSSRGNFFNTEIKKNYTHHYFREVGY